MPPRRGAIKRPKEAQGKRRPTLPSCYHSAVGAAPCLGHADGNKISIFLRLCFDSVRSAGPPTPPSRSDASARPGSSCNHSITVSVYTSLFSVLSLSRAIKKKRPFLSREEPMTSCARPLMNGLKPQRLQTFWTPTTCCPSAGMPEECSWIHSSG